MTSISILPSVAATTRTGSASDVVQPTAPATPAASGGGSLLAAAGGLTLLGGGASLVALSRTGNLNGRLGALGMLCATTGIALLAFGCTTPPQPTRRHRTTDDPSTPGDVDRLRRQEDNQQQLCDLAGLSSCPNPYTDQRRRAIDNLPDEDRARERHRELQRDNMRRMCDLAEMATCPNPF